MICPKCNNKTFEDFEVKDARFKICVKCGQAIQIKESEEYNNYCAKQQKIKEELNSKSSKPTVTCPYCHSTNTKKISTMSKAGSVALFGVFAMGRVGKQFHCNNCGADF